MNFRNPLYQIDFYKADHRRQYPVGTTEVYSNFTPRSSHDGSKEIVWFGLQAFLEQFNEGWQTYFFDRSKEQVVAEYEAFMLKTIGGIPVDHVAALHDLGYLPLDVRALPEGSVVPLRVPVLTVRNTHPDFFWLTNYIESVMSAALWKACTSATTARKFKAILPGDWQGHDFSFRGMSGVEDAAMSGAGHLLSYFGTDNIPAILWVEEFYGPVTAGSVAATEHSVMCMDGPVGELETFRRILALYPGKIVSIVSDTWDFWSVLKNIVPQVVGEVTGKLVIRPDSGDPVKIVSGDDDAPEGSIEREGALPYIIRKFGHLNGAFGRRVGLIYGDGITYDRACRMTQRLAAKGCPIDDLVLGIGSYTYQYVTRDTHGWAMKATSGVVNGQRRSIYKTPKTDDGGKKSAVGLLRVDKVGGRYTLTENVTEDQAGGELRPVFLDGKMLVRETFATIRERLAHE